MSDSDNDSSNEGKPSSSKGSSKSSKKSRRPTAESEKSEDEFHENGNKTARSKKKGKRRTSASLNVASDAETSDGEPLTSKRSESRERRKSSKTRTKRRPSKGEGEIEAPAVQDSMLMTIKKKRSQANAMNGASGGMSKKREAMFKDVSFSGSTIVRDNDKKNSRELDIAMGKIPKPDTEETDSQLMSNVARKMPQPISKSTSGALKPSKYGGNNEKKKIGFADQQQQVEQEPTTLTAMASTRKAKLSFRPVEYGSEEDDDIGRRVPSRSSSTSSLKDYAEQQQQQQRSFGNNKPPQSAMKGHTEEFEFRPGQMGNRQSSWQPDRIGPSKPQQENKPQSQLGGERRPIRRSTSEASADGFRSSFNAAQRPGIQRRDSMGSMTSKRRISKDLLRDYSGDGDDDIRRTSSASEDKRTSFMRKAKSAAHINQHKQIRRLRMSMANQTYIPPKSRQTSMFQAMTHRMAGLTVDLTLWTYQTSFLKVMLFFLAFYITNIFLWAAVLDAVDLASGGVCIHEDPEALSRSDRYEYVFELSWATFTTGE